MFSDNIAHFLAKQTQNFDFNEASMFVSKDYTFIKTPPLIGRFVGFPSKSAFFLGSCDSWTSFFSLSCTLQTFSKSPFLHLNNFLSFFSKRVCVRSLLSWARSACVANFFKNTFFWWIAYCLQPSYIFRLKDSTVHVTLLWHRTPAHFYEILQHWIQISGRVRKPQLLAYIIRSIIIIIIETA